MAIISNGRLEDICLAEERQTPCDQYGIDSRKAAPGERIRSLLCSSDQKAVFNNGTPTMQTSNGDTIMDTTVSGYGRQSTR